MVINTGRALAGGILLAAATAAAAQNAPDLPPPLPFAANAPIPAVRWLAVPLNSAPRALAAATGPQVPSRPHLVDAVLTHLHPEALSVGLLHQNSITFSGTPTMSQLRAGLHARVRVAIAPRDQLALVMGGGTGPLFRSGWNHTAVGPLDPVSRLYVKQLFVVSRPGRGAEIQVGSFQPVRGEATEMTGMDNDGYLTGTRVTVRDRRRVWFDEVGMTRAAVNDLDNPDAFHRIGHVASGGYLQALAVRRLQAASFSIEFAHRDTLNSAGGTLLVRRVPGLTAVRVEAVADLAHGTHHALAVVGERRVGQLTLSTGFTSIDAPFAVLNGDRYTAGERGLLIAAWRFHPAVVVGAFASRAIGDAREPRVRADAWISCNALTVLSRRRASS